MWRYFVLRSSKHFSHKDHFDRRSMSSNSILYGFSTNSIPNSISFSITTSSNSIRSLLRFSTSEILACSSFIYFIHEAMSRLWPLISDQFILIHVLSCLYSSISSVFFAYFYVLICFYNLFYSCTYLFFALFFSAFAVCTNKFITGVRSIR